jgi:hypothetical protein
VRSPVKAWLIGVGIALISAVPQPAVAQTAGDAGEVHGLKLGLQAQSMTLDGWSELACGSNGGPPRQNLNAWADFAECRSEANGLHEVTARFDDEAEYVAKAMGNPDPAAETGTRVAGHPVILSALFNDGGTLRGIRIISDPRAAERERRMAHLLGVAVMSHYGRAGWTCTDLAPAQGETPVGGIFIKSRCEKSASGKALTVETHFLRKPGQHDVDPETHDYTQGQFESWTRFEIMDADYRK